MTFLGTAPRDVFGLKGGLKENRGQRWECDAEGEGPAVEIRGACLQASQVPLAAAIVILGIAVENLLPVAAAGHAHVVALAGLGGEIADDKENILR